MLTVVTCSDYNADFGNSLSLGVNTGNYFFADILDDQVITLDPTKPHSFRIEKYDNGLIQVYLGDESGFADEPVLEAIDTTYATLGRVSWSVSTQTAGKDFFVEYIRAEVPAVQKTEPEKPAEDDLIKQVAVQSNNSYQISKLNEGETFFTDRPYTVTSVPEFLQGASFIKPPNNDKSLTTSGNFMTVYLKEPAIAYVAYDPRSTQLPAWLSDWTKTDLTIGTTDPGSPFYEVYSKRVPSAIFATYRNQLRIGANLAAPAVGSNMNYLVAFVAVPNFARYEAEDATLSGPVVASNQSRLQRHRLRRLHQQEQRLRGVDGRLCRHRSVPHFVSVCQRQQRGPQPAGDDRRPGSGHGTGDADLRLDIVAQRRLRPGIDHGGRTPHPAHRPGQQWPQRGLPADHSL